MSIQSRRQKAGLSQIDAAKAIGISRQAFASIEAQRAVPSVKVALRLAELFATTVEDLFAERDWTVPATKGSSDGRVAVARVGDRWVARSLRGREHELGADGIASKGNVSLLRPPSLVRENVLVVGCAPALGAIAERLNGERGRGRFVWLPTSSTLALDDLAGERAHVGGIHFGSASDNQAAIEKRLGRKGFARIAFADWEIGLAVARGNPKKIRGVTNALSRGTCVALREPGSGARRAFDQLLRKAGAHASEIASAIVVHDHRAIGSLIATGAADVGFTVRDVAIAHDLDFIALGSERFDLVVPRDLLGDLRIQRWLDGLSGASTRREMVSLGYDVTHTGEAA